MNSSGSRWRRPSPSALGLEFFTTRWDRLLRTAQRAGVSPVGLVLLAEGIVWHAYGPALHYLEWPNSSAASPTILMLRGGGLHAHTLDLVNLQRHRARCLAVDPQGHGEGEWAEPAQYGSDPIGEDIDAVVSALSLTEMVLVDHSLGGVAAIVWAARPPKVLRGLVVVDVAREMNSAGTASVGQSISAGSSFADVDGVREFASTAPDVDPRLDELAANLRRVDDDRLSFKYDTYQFSSIQVARGDELRRIVSAISCPTTILRGQRSRFTSAAAAAELAEFIPGARAQTIPSARHTSQSSNPSALAESAAALLGDTGRDETHCRTAIR